MKYGVLIGVGFALWASASPAGHEPEQQFERNWSQTAVDDLHFIRAVLRENHPGPVDDRNNDFAHWHRTGFDEAITMARRATDYAGYHFAIKYYTNGFSDGHLGALTEDILESPRLDRYWAGFVTTLLNGEFVVARSSSSETDAPPVGAVVRRCDGVSTHDLAERNLHRFVGLWSLNALRAELAPMLLIDEGNPFRARPRSCEIEIDGRLTTVPLKWRPLGETQRAAVLALARPSAEARFELRRFAENRYWISLPSFNANRDEVATANRELRQAIASQAPELREAEMLVFDVRGNRGGSSEIGVSLLGVIWGEAYIRSITPVDVVEWRVSPGNLRFLRRYNLPALENQFGAESPQVRAYEAFIEQFQAALDGGDVRFREADEPPSKSSALPVRSEIILLTDNNCASACLDFADVLIGGLGATHVGQETRADTLYIDNRAVTLPSGQGRLGFSMKVFRQRVRGSNESYVPVHRFHGDVSDTDAVMEWILRLPATTGEQSAVE